MTPIAITPGFLVILLWDQEDWSIDENLHFWAIDWKSTKKNLIKIYELFFVNSSEKIFSYVWVKKDSGIESVHILYEVTITWSYE